MTRSIARLAPSGVVLLLAASATAQPATPTATGQAETRTSALAPTPVAWTAQPDQEQADVEWKVDWFPRPAIKWGDRFELDLKVLVQIDGRWFDPELTDPVDQWGNPRRRLGIEGRVTRFLEYEVEGDVDREDPWRDVYLNVRVRPWLQFQGGKFKVEYGRERTRTQASIDTIERSNATNALTPGRTIGGMVHGRTAARTFEYAVGAFQKDPISEIEIDEDVEPRDIAEAKSMWAARLVTRPLRWRDPDGYGGFEIGASLARTKLEQGLNSLRGRNIYDYDFFERVYVNGQRWRWGVDAYLEAGPTSVSAEYLEGSDDRLEQGIRDDDLPDLVSRGWYLTGTWALTGEPKDRVDRPRRPLLDGGIGAVELVTRIENLQLASRETRGEPPFRNPRAVNLLPNADTAWTGGVNWYPVRYIRLQGFATWEHFRDEERTPLLGERNFWSFVARFQLAM